MKLINLIIILFIVLSIFTAKATVKSNPNNVVTNKIIDQILARHNFQGTALITKNDVAIHHRGYGLAVIEWNISNSTTTKFRIASLSKTFTGTLVMKMVEDGYLALDKSVSEYLPEYLSEYSSQITIRHLLTHRTGIPRLSEIPDWSNVNAHSRLSKSEFLRMIAKMSLAFQPDSTRLYSSANYYILGAIIEEVTGKPFGTVLNETILHPLNMKNTDVFRPGQPIKELANAYKQVKGQYSFCPPVSGNLCIGNNINFALFIASGSMHSTTEDLFVWLQTLESNLLLNERSRAFILDSKNSAGWDYQTVLFPDNKRRNLIIADGELEGNSSLLVNLPEQRISMILLNNTGMTYDEKSMIALEIATVLLGI